MAHLRWSFFLVLSSAILSAVVGQTMPAGCSYTDGMYACDYDVLNTNSLIPLSETQFSPNPPQRIQMFNLPVTLPTPLFNSTFSSIATASYDTNYPATLELRCSNGSSTTLVAGCLAAMSHIQYFKIINCDLGSISANVFSELGSLDRFVIENGTVTDFDASALSGVSIAQQTSASPSFQEKFGEFALINTKVTTMSNAFLTSQTSLNSLVLENIGLTTIDSAFLSAFTSLHRLTLSYNALTSLPAGLFDGLTELAEVKLYGSTLDCTCDALWFLETKTVGYATVLGDIICASPTEYLNKKARKYYSDTCIAETVECADGTNLLGTCLSPIDLTAYSLTVVAFIVGWIALGLTIHTIKTGGAPPPGRGRGRRKPGNAGKKPKLTKISKA